MTREEAIKIIDCYDIGFYDLSGEKIPADKLADAFDMAIEALSRSGDLISRADAIEMAVDVETPQGTYERAIYVDDLMALPSADAPKGDLISRRWLLDLYGDYIGDNGEPKYHVPLEVVRQNIKDAPSADAVSREEYNDLLRTKISFANATIPTFAESAEAYKAWTGEEMGKTHGRLIDADALYKKATHLWDKSDSEDFEKGIFKLILNAPTVSADRPQGEWIERLAYNTDLDVDVPYIECDQCGHRPYFCGSYRPKYCEECGAKMDGNTDNQHGFTADEWYRNTFKDGDDE